MIPGPNVALIVANSLRYGARMGVATVLGTTLGVALQLLFVVTSLAVIVELVADALSWIRWAGVAYLVWLGLRTWCEPAGDLRYTAAAPKKTLLFNAAFLPQFVNSGEGATVELAVAALVFLTVLLVGDMLWAVFAGSARRLLDKYSTARNRMTGGFLVAAGIGLALSRRVL
jgi:threonine/homoserine/homoserine lactone efflux protein